MTFSVYILQFIVFLDLLAVGMLVPLVPAHAQGLGASHVQVGLMGSVYAACQLVSGPIFGSLSDLKGRKPILIITLILPGIAYALKGFASSVFLFLCLRGVLGIFKQTQMLSRAIVPEYVASEKTQSEIYGKMAATSGLGITLGPAIGGHIIESYPESGFKYIAIATGLCFIINAGLVYVLPKSHNQRKRCKEKASEIQEPLSLVQFVGDSLKQSVAGLWRVQWGSFWDVMLLKGLIAFALGIYYSNYSTYLKGVYHLTPKYIGYIISFQGIVGAVACYFIGYINSFYQNDEDYSLRNLHVFVLISVSLAGLILSHNVYFYMLWLIPLAVGNAVGRLTSLELVLARSGARHRGALLGASASVRSLAGILAPAAAGLIQQYVGVPYPIYAALVATLLGIVMSCYIRSCSTKDHSDDYEYRNDKIKTD